MLTGRGGRISRNRKFGFWSSKATNDLTNLYLLLPNQALSIINLRLAQCQDNITEWDIRSWFWWQDLAVGQQYKISINVHCHKLGPIVI